MLESLNGSEKSGKDLTMTRRIGKKERHSFGPVLMVLLTFLVAFRISAQQVSLAPRTMSRLGTVDERFQSYNIERELQATSDGALPPLDGVSVRGGRFRAVGRGRLMIILIFVIGDGCPRCPDAGSCRSLRGRSG